MSLQEHELVHPSGPSVLPKEDSELYLLNSNDLLINFTLDIAYIVPSRLDVSELRVALARTLASFPLFCGQLVQEPEWAISVSSLRPVPLTIKHELEPKWDPSSISTNQVVRPQPYPQIERINPLNLLNGVEPELFKATIVTTDKATLIGISCSHIPADLFIVLKFLRTWSQHFTHPLGPITEPAPVHLSACTVSTHLTTPSDPAQLEYIRSKLPPLLFHTFPLDNIPASIFAPFPIRRIDVRFSAARVAALHAAVLAAEAEGPDGDREQGASAHWQLSRQDTLSAFIVTSLNASYDTPVAQISNVVNCRGINPAILPKDAVGNGLLYAVTDSVDVASYSRHAADKTLVLAYARAIRRSLVRTRDPAFVHDFLALAGAEWLGAAKRNRGHHIEETPGHVIVNSSYRHDWASTHFGYPGKACWQHPDPVPTDNYVLFFPSNPVLMSQGEKGESVWSTDQGACEATFHVKTGREGDFAAATLRIWSSLVGEGHSAPDVVMS
ncbi:hypothetical protein C8Q74DRAFT_538839 [Fomes fomentarius]|nr:hypothetical protein C8Q74DRAFT_538839 [Fomes fomentarius]